MSNEYGSRSGMLLAFIAGAATGALVMALTTPKSGEEMRGDLQALGRRVRGKMGEMSDEACETWGDVKERTGKAASQVKRGIQEAAEQLRG